MRTKRNPWMRRARGFPYMTSVQFLDFLTQPLPPVTHRDQLILFLLSAFWGPPSPTHCGRHIWKPLTLTFIPFKSGSLSFVSVRSVFPPQHEKITLGRKRKRIQVQSDDLTMLGDVQKVSHSMAMALELHVKSAANSSYS